MALEVRLDPEATFYVQYEVRLGALRHAWEEGPFGPDDAGTLLLAPSAPAEAWLDALARDYVTFLKASVVIDRVDGRWAGRTLAPPAFLVWPAGPERDACVWDLERVRRDAPAGVLSAQVRGGLSSDAAWVLPPISYLVPPPTEDLRDED